MCVGKYFLVASHKFPLFFFPYFSDHRKRRKDRIISAFSNPKSTWSHVALLLVQQISYSFLHSFFSFFFYFQFFFFIIIRKCVASCNHKQNVHNTPLQGSFDEKGLDYLSVLVRSCVAPNRFPRHRGVVISTTAFALFFGRPYSSILLSAS